MKANNKSNIQGIGCLILFFAPFVIVGLGTFMVSSYGLIKDFQTYSWVQTEAQLERNRFEVDYRDGPDDVDTYKNHLTYTYSIDGQMYQGDRVGFGYSKNNIDRHSEVYNKLKYARKIKVWVNPNNLKESSMTQGTNESTVALFLFSLMWNSLISIFLLPLSIPIKEEEENSIDNWGIESRKKYLSKD